MGAPTWPPSPQTFGTPRRSRGAPLGQRGEAMSPKVTIYTNVG